MNLSFVSAEAEARCTRYVTLRLFPGVDIRKTLVQWALDNAIGAAFVASAVGSLKAAALRFADQSETFTATAKYEIVSLSGMISTSGVHLHMSIADAKGQTIGGHVQVGNLVYTTLELVLGVQDRLQCERRDDPRTGFRKLFPVLTGPGT